MAKFKNDKGLTLIELLITIAVLAVVSAIALPVINNVVSSSNSNAAAQTQGDVDDFIAKYNAAGEVLVSADGRTLQGYVDTDGDNTIDSNELIDTLTIDAKFSFAASGSSDNVGGSYTSKGITGATAGLASNGGTTPPPSAGPSMVFSQLSGWWSGTNTTLTLSSYDASTRVAVITQPRSVHGMCMWNLRVGNSSGDQLAWIDNSPGEFSKTDDGTTCTYTIDLNTIASTRGITINPATDVFAMTAGSWGPNKAFSIQ
jgi:prepilin-type N-terminal cleavage/methylation domain-containing protein